MTGMVSGSWLPQVLLGRELSEFLTSFAGRYYFPPAIVLLSFSDGRTCLPVNTQY